MRARWTGICGVILVIAGLTLATRAQGAASPTCRSAAVRALRIIAASDTPAHTAEDAYPALRADARLAHATLRAGCRSATANPRTSWMKTDCTHQVRVNCFRDGTHPLYITRTRRVDEFGNRYLGHILCHYWVHKADVAFDWCEVRRPSR